MNCQASVQGVIIVWNDKKNESHLPVIKALLRTTGLIFNQKEF